MCILSNYISREFINLKISLEINANVRWLHASVQRFEGAAPACATCVMLPSLSGTLGQALVLSGIKLLFQDQYDWSVSFWILSHVMIQHLTRPVVRMQTNLSI